MVNSLCPQCARHDPDMTHPSLFDVTTTCQILSISRSTFYLLVKEGRIVVSKLGSKTLISSYSIERFVKQVMISGFPLVCLMQTVFIAAGQRHADNQDARLDSVGELHLGESLEEKLALSDRFGLALGFFSFNQDTYLEIVKRYAEKDGVPISPSILRSEALRWSLDRSSRSGRTARQFVDDVIGRLALESSGDRAGKSEGS
mgnify:CR=1 FL=1